MIIATFVIACIALVTAIFATVMAVVALLN